jgi:NAD(P)-dependent dehydrogenase (short-subunit alcohol dehydrogenase family)
VSTQHVEVIRMTTQDPGQDIDLRGQVALVTGGGRGIGREVALGLARAGAAVAVVARSADQIAETASLIAASGGRAIALTADVTDRDAVEQAVAETERKLGPIDLLVNDAGRMRAFGPVVDVDPDEWWREVEVNLRGPFLCARAVLPGMLSRRKGRIVNVASGAGLSTFACLSSYTSSKAALIRLTDALAAETREFGVSVFAIHPGTLRTPMNLGMQRIAEAWHPGTLSPQLAERMAEFFPRMYAEGRDTPIEAPVRLVLLLASGRADVLSGRYLSVFDDVAELIRRADEIQRDDLYTMRLRK